MLTIFSLARRKINCTSANFASSLQTLLAICGFTKNATVETRTSNAVGAIFIRTQSLP